MQKNMQKEMQKEMRREMCMKAGAVLAALVFWQVLSTVIRQRILLVSPLAVFLRLTTLWQEKDFLPVIGYTFGHIAGGFLLGLLTGILLAAVAARYRFLEILLWPWMAVIKSVPVASFVVICLIWLSSRNLSVFISFLVVVPVIYQNILSGLKACDPKLHEMADVFRIPRLRRIRYIILPQLRPYIMAGCSLTVNMAWKAGVAAEILGNPPGSIGKMISLSKMYLDTDDLLAWVVIIVLLSAGFGKLFLYLLGKLLDARS